MRKDRILFFVLLFIQTVTPALGEDASFNQRENVVYAEVHGIGLLMDVFVPIGEKNGCGIVDVISGAWYSDRGKIRDHSRAQTFQILCKKGFTVFAVRPGSVTKFTVPEMQANLNHGITWVKEHAKEFSIDPSRLGMMGASAGGHLASLAAVTANDGTGTDSQGSPIADTRVQAVAVFLPPTDFLIYGKNELDLNGDDRLGLLFRRLAFPEGLKTPSREEAIRLITQISPARLVTPKTPPFLLIHGDADTMVPLQQSQVMLEALKREGVSAELIVKPGGGHPWPTMHEEVAVMANWFEKLLVIRPEKSSTVP